MLRSETMIKLDIVMQRDTVHDAVFHIGRTGMVQFLDCNEGTTTFQRNYTGEIRRCDDIERRLRYIGEQMRKGGVQPHTVDPAFAGDLAAMIDMNEVENMLEEAEKELRELNAAIDNMTTEKNRSREYYEILRRDVDGAVPEAPPVTFGNSGYQSRSEGAPMVDRRHGLMYVAAVAPDKNIALLSRMIYRVTRGNCLLRIESIEEGFVDKDGNRVEKSVIAVYVSANRAIDKIKRLVESMGGTCYSYTEDNMKTAHKLKNRLVAIDETMEQSLARRDAVLGALAANFKKYYGAILCEKAVFINMNLLDITGSVARGQCWIAERDLDTLYSAIEEGSLRFGGDSRPVVRRAADQSNPPTYFRTNKYTEVFQGIVDSYGTARYKEINPGVMTIVTFPYLFGIMYGDIGHGTLITLVAAYLVFKERDYLGRPLNEIFGMIFGGRYLILAMGIMAVYIGILYNDFFGFSVQLFRSGYVWPHLPPHGPSGIVAPLLPNGRPHVRPREIYEFGIDVAWSETENKLEFYNSVKMKCAVIIGVIQMLGGLLLSLLNHIHHKKWRHVLFGFIPEFVFLTCTFGYMSLLIIIKWCKRWDNTNHAPSLLETMTNFFLAPGVVTQPLFHGQAVLQVFLLLISFAMVPLMLCAIPFLEWRDRKKAGLVARSGYHTIGSNSGAFHDGEEGGGAAHPSLTSASAGGGDHSGHNQDFSEVVIHYIIHTIEFVLGCVSNTASYLRLWALSLAHAQLSEVFLNFGLVGALNADGGNGIVVFVGVAAWFGATIGVLCLMESLSAFLHALRLHWVEFQNKFYSGDGIAYEPLDLIKIASDVNNSTTLTGKAA